MYLKVEDRLISFLKTINYKIEIERQRCVRLAMSTSVTVATLLTVGTACNQIGKVASHGPQVLNNEYIIADLRT